MSLDLSDMMEDLFAAEDSLLYARVGSVVTLIDKKAARESARQARKLAKKDLLELAGKENIELWQQAIANWMQQHQGAKVSLWQLQQALGMPLVEVGRGLAWSTAFTCTLSVGWHRGVLSGCTGDMDYY